MNRVLTGIDGLDKMLKGGLPARRSILVCGSPGAGKTILSWQFLYNGAVHYNEPGLYVSLDEDIDDLKEEITGFGWGVEISQSGKEAQGLGWDIRKLEREGKLEIIDASPIRLVPAKVKIGNISVGKRDFNLASLMEIIRQKAEKINAKRVVIDPITTLIFQYDDISERRTATLDLFEALKRLGTTNLIITELKKVIFDREIHAEEYLAHGVIVLYTHIGNSEIFRSIRVEKMRGIEHDNQIRPYDITSKGIQVFPHEQLIRANVMVQPNTPATNI